MPPAAAVIHHGESVLWRIGYSFSIIGCRESIDLDRRNLQLISAISLFQTEKSAIFPACF
jgi:hypothetical protein